MSMGIEPGAFGNIPERMLRPQGGFGGANPLGPVSKIGQPGGDFDAALSNQVLESEKTTAPKGFLDGFISSVDTKQKAAAESRQAFLSGESNNLHQTMIASQEASVAFALMVEMRNKVMEAYQELMRMQI